ncbi:class I SAM-dependent methyltransferase [Labedaea rhizosphaerae]|uniref:Methyltransferase family protein n=1 Tax=Labedaea rhizosphaerae TaxID=598644 RepID=A0A4R6S5M3_LABRH|nr:class I SAM-dependent methyltransferase [Labedaea rhizosphaerae]TDP94035.1 methyltransferase family protein [Labedaea rhizosphaerae]
MSFEQTRRDWARLGASDPLWAVYVAPGTRNNNWDVEAFLELGRADVAKALAWLDSLDLPTRWASVLDFGCGAGRLSQALAAHADAVTGVDVAPAMLDTARALDRTGGRCTSVLNERPDLSRFADDTFELVYTELVLQHLPRPLIERYLAEFLRVLRPGGVAVFQCTTRPLNTAKGLVWRVMPFPVIRLLQRVVLRYPAPMRMTAVSPSRVRAVVEAHGGRVIDSRAEDVPSTHWRSATYVVRKR